MDMRLNVFLISENAGKFNTTLSLEFCHISSFYYKLFSFIFNQISIYPYLVIVPDICHLHEIMKYWRDEFRRKSNVDFVVSQYSNCDLPACGLQWQAWRSELTCNIKGVIFIFITP